MVCMQCQELKNQMEEYIRLMIRWLYLLSMLLQLQNSLFQIGVSWMLIGSRNNKSWIWPIRSNLRADAIGLFPQKVTKCRLLFFEKIRFKDFWKNGRDGNSDRWDSVGNFILSGGCTEGGALCAGNAKGRSSMLGLRGKAHYRVKGETPCPVIWCLRQVVLGIIWRIVLPKIIFGNDRHMKKSLWNARGR